MSDETPQDPTNEPTPSDVPAAPRPTEPIAPTPAAAPTEPIQPMPAASMPTEPMASMPAVESTESPRGNKGKRTLAMVIAALVVLAAGGAAFAFMQLRGSSDTLMSQIPASADVVATAYLDPAASQKVNLFRMTDQFPVLGSESDLTARLNTLLDQSGQQVGLNHNDFQWLGSQVAVVADFPGAATPNIEVLINVDDVSAAKATVAKLRNGPSLGGATWRDTQYKGVTVSSSSSSAGAYAFVGNTLVFGSTTTGVDSIIDTDQGGASLADSSDFKATSDGLPDGRLAFVYVNVKALLPLVQAAMAQTGAVAGGLDVTALQALRGIGITISAESNGLAMDVNEALDPTKLSDFQKAVVASAHDNPLVSYVPSNALALAQVEHVDLLLNAVIKQVETTNPAIASELAKEGLAGPGGLLSTLTGDMAFELSPGTAGLPVSGAMVVGINDQAAFGAAITKLKDQLGTNSSCSGGTGLITASPASSVLTPEKCTQIPAQSWQTETYKGTKINFLADGGTFGGGPTVAYATVDGAGFIGLGPDSIKAVIDAKAGQNITSNATFNSAKGSVPSKDEFVYLDVHGLLQAVAATSSDPTVSQVATTLAPVKAVAIGSESTSSSTHVRFLILIP